MREFVNLDAFAKAFLKESIQAVKNGLIDKEEYAKITRSRFYALCLHQVHPASFCCSSFRRSDQPNWDAVSLKEIASRGALSFREIFFEEELASLKEYIDTHPTNDPTDLNAETEIKFYLRNGLRKIFQVDSIKFVNANILIDLKV